MAREVVVDHDTRAWLEACLPTGPGAFGVVECVYDANLRYRGVMNAAVVYGCGGVGFFSSLSLSLSSSSSSSSSSASSSFFFLLLLLRLGCSFLVVVVVFCW